MKKSKYYSILTILKTQYPKDKTVAELFEEQVDYHLLKMQYFLKEII